MAKKIEYSKIKLIGWRFARVFIAGALLSIATQINVITKVEDLLPVLVLPALTAGLVALAKAVREYIADGDYTSLISKLPL